ncbi:MAG: hypothetical protein AAGE59_03670 [Cyanobacteria bacterium P01_F01_bin.86]
MARSLEQILKDLESLTAATHAVDQDLKDLYKQYLDVLSKAVKRQLVLATYHLCTQIYPEAFLKLSVSQREKVQTGIRKIAGQGQAQIEQLKQVVTMEGLVTAASNASAHSPPASPLADNTSDDDASREETVLANEENTPPTTDEKEPETEREETPPVPTDDAINANALETSEIAQRLSSALSLFAAFSSAPLSPVNLAKRHVLLERQLRAILQTVSNLSNYLLKQAHILPDLPEMVIAAAAEAEAGESGQSAPNLLNVLVEMGRDRDQDELEENKHPETLDEEDPESSMTHLVAINLRLADIEFADAHTALWRSKLQEVLARLKRLGSRYQKLQREKAQAEAEYAWRATWFED